MLEKGHQTNELMLLYGRVSHISGEICHIHEPTQFRTVCGKLLCTESIFHGQNASFQGFRTSPDGIYLLCFFLYFFVFFVCYGLLC